MASMSSRRSPSFSPADSNVLPITVFVPVHVPLRPVNEITALLRAVDRPARQDPRDLDDVLLRVAAVHAERVEFHQLARVVLVQAGLRPLLLRGLLLEALRELLALLRREPGIASAAAAAFGGSCGPLFGARLWKLSR